MNPFRSSLTVLICLMLAACGGEQATAPTPPAPTAAPLAADGEPTTGTTADTTTDTAAPTAASMDTAAQQVADMLQACSYDGATVSFSIAGEAPDDCREMVDVIMRYTGLPQNFEVFEADVPNAAAVIVVGDDNLPHRVIGFNPEFIDLVDNETNNTWAAVSIMAHEIGHHLSGHTIQPGGSQPPIELEADKFSGFVLYKMGATLDDALIAMRTLVKDEADGDTHPGRTRRLNAITEGWMQSCQQTGRADCDNGLPPGDSTAEAPTNEPQVTETPTDAPQATETPTDAPQATDQPQATDEPQVTETPTDEPQATPEDDMTVDVDLDTTVVLPLPDPDAIPYKSTQFIYDETGMLDKPTIAKYEQQFFQHAQQWGVEIATLIVKDLHGLSAEAYAQSMMRQLRVGKLDVGNGAVLVYAPEQRQFAMAVGSGIMNEVKEYVNSFPTTAETLFDIYDLCKAQGGCDATTTDVFMLGVDALRYDTDDMEWTVRYQNFADIHGAFLKAFEANDLNNDPANDAIARLEGTVESLNADVCDDLIGMSRVRDGYVAVKVTGRGGEQLLLYMLPETMALQPGDALKEGKSYVFIAREVTLTPDPTDLQSFDLLSYVESK